LDHAQPGGWQDLADRIERDAFAAEGAALRDAELEIVVRVVEAATQDKVGRYEMPRADIATMKKIANPLKLGVMHEAAFVVGHDWPQLIEREAAELQELTVSELREFIEKEQQLR
jgi:hypothetical protein